VNTRTINDYIVEANSNKFNPGVTSVIKHDVIQWFIENKFNLYKFQYGDDFNWDDYNSIIIVRQHPKRPWRQQIVVGFKNKESAMHFKLSWDNA
jgi:hypothetical protein